MKRILERLKNSGLYLFAVLLLCSLLGIGGVDVMCAESGTITYDTPLSLEYANEHAPDIVRATIERDVAVIRPHSAPLYAIASKHGRIKQGTNPLIEYHEIESQGLSTKLASFFSGGVTQAAINLSDNKLVAVNQTLYFIGVPGSSGSSGWFEAYIIDKDTSGRPIIVPVNGIPFGGNDNTIPSLPMGTVVVRGARTGSEKQSRTAPLTATPQKKYQYMQKMILETEETTFFEFSSTGADVKWQKTELTDFAIFEHKMTCETDMLLGQKNKIRAANKFNGYKEEDTYFQEGIWWQAGKDFSLAKTSPKTSDLIALMKCVFVGNRSSNTKVLLAGGDVVETINKVDYNQVIYPGTPGQSFGLDVQSIIYGQYKLYICGEPAFDDIGLSDKGIVIDDAYLTKYKHDWRSIQLDNLKLGTSDSKSQVYIDTFGLVLANAKAHCRVELV
ncbi:MAG: hypothetical protein LBH80_02810 [Prevotellaceae bacterium]|jgi:hypothetical protein|nr:hypothetical protein [Prevotellaceae bacterium]